VKSGEKKKGGETLSRFVKTVIAAAACEGITAMREQSGDKNNGHGLGSVKEEEDRTSRKNKR